MDNLKVFVPITKIDAGKRLVYGVVTAEAPDVSGEVCDYASTKPLYQKWSQSFAGATNGKSFGNLRAMHGNVAAGKLVEIASLGRPSLPVLRVPTGLIPHIRQCLNDVAMPGRVRSNPISPVGQFYRVQALGVGDQATDDLCA